MRFFFTLLLCLLSQSTESSERLISRPIVIFINHNIITAAVGWVERQYLE
jgi:hypothetical protein